MGSSQALPSEATAASVPLQSGYERRQPEQTLLYRVVQDNLETLLVEHPALPEYVAQEFWT